MLKNRLIEGRTLSTSVFLNNEDHASDRDFVFQNTLDFETLVNINGIVDFESIEYKPTTDKIELDLFFLKYLDKPDITEISKYIEFDFLAYSSQHFNFNIGEFLDIQKPTSELFEINDSNGLISPITNNEASLSPININDIKPQILVNPITEITKKYPTKPGYPHFYNTLTFPLWDNKDAWIKTKFGFNNKVFTYNSFILVELYDSFNVETQKKITTIPIYVSDRYMFSEKIRLSDTNKQKRPVFNLTEGVDGFSLFFLGNYHTNEFYAKFYFWDALNGTKIQFIPSSKTNLNKKWLQTTNDFDQKILYVKYELNYTDKTYKIYDLNKKSGRFDLEATEHLDLYEFGYDDYWTQYPIINKQPTDVMVPVPPRQYGELMLSSTYINREVIYQDTMLVAKDLLTGVKNLDGYEDVKITFKNKSFSYDENNNYTEDDVIYYFDVYGSSLGYLTRLGNNTLTNKVLGLLKTTNNICVNTEINSHEISAGSILIDNISSINTYVIEDIYLTNLLVNSDESATDLTINGSLTHKIKKNVNSDPSTFHEVTIVPRRISSTVSNTTDKDILNQNLTEAWDTYKSSNEEQTVSYLNPYIYMANWYPTPKYGDPQLNANVSKTQTLLALKLIKTDYIKNPFDFDVNEENIVSLLKTDPKLVKERGITIVIESLDSVINSDEEIILTVKLFLGSDFLYNFGLIKNLKITGDLNLSTYKISDGQDSDKNIIKIPFNITLK